MVGREDWVIVNGACPSSSYMPLSRSVADKLDIEVKNSEQTVQVVQVAPQA